MPKNIEPNLKLISGYLKLENKEYFLIPEYQRGYAWEITQCDKLWQDIEAFIESDATDPYFFGTIILDCSNPENPKSNHAFKLIDGQQRTTTFLLLLKALLIRLNTVISKISDSDDESVGLKAGLNANRNIIMELLYKADAEIIPAMLKDHTKTRDIKILENKSINESHHTEVQIIIEAFDFEDAEENVYKFARKQKDNKYTNYFRNFKFFYEKLGEKSETQLNTFAKYFLKQCQIIEIRSWDTEQAITMFNSLNSTGLPLSDGDIISAQLYSKSGEKTEDFNEKWKNINRLTERLGQQKVVSLDSVLQQYMYIRRAIDKSYINGESVDVTMPGLRKYFLNINPKLLDAPIDFCENLEKITMIWDTIKGYQKIKLLLKFNENAKIYLISYLFRFEVNQLDEAMISDIVDCLMRLFAIMELVDSGYSSKHFKTFLFGINIRLVDRSVPISEVIEEFNKHINAAWQKSHITEAIGYYENNILVYLHEYLYATEKGFTFDFDENVNVEHIMPASGRNKHQIREDATIEDGKEFDNLVNKIGNKMLLEEDINKSIGNDWFRTKKQNSVKEKSGYKDSKYAIAIALSNYHKDNWTKEDIEIATNGATERIMKYIFG